MKWFFNIDSLNVDKIAKSSSFYRSGFDANGEPVHGSMYYKMFTNESKEYMEYADYTFEEHFKGQNVPSYMPRAVIREYLIGG